MPTYTLLRLMASKLHGLRLDCLFKAVTLGWVAKTVPCSLENDYIRFCDPFEILQAKFKRVSSTETACLVPRTLNKQSAPRVKPTNVISMYLT